VLVVALPKAGWEAPNGEAGAPKPPNPVAGLGAPKALLPNAGAVLAPKAGAELAPKAGCEAPNRPPVAPPKGAACCG